jgi:aryl-alcohol dehydrogenase-like predicted oxidoreductase
MFIATKFNAAGATRWGGDDVSGQASFDRSLVRLKTDHVELLMAHYLDSVEPLMPLMQQLKKAGKTRYIGITTVSEQEHPRLIEYMRKYPIDFVQVDYSLGNREAAASVFPVALERKIAVMIAVPLGGHRGSLLGQANGHELPAWAADIDVSSWSQFFLKYVISHPAVTCAIPGSSKVQHIEDNQMAGHGRVPDTAFRNRMEQSPRRQNRARLDADRCGQAAGCLFRIATRSFGAGAARGVRYLGASRQLAGAQLQRMARAGDQPGDLRVPRGPGH